MKQRTWNKGRGTKDVELPFVLLLINLLMRQDFKHQDFTFAIIANVTRKALNTGLINLCKLAWQVAK